MCWRCGPRARTWLPHHGSARRAAQAVPAGPAHVSRPVLSGRRCRAAGAAALMRACQLGKTASMTSTRTRTNLLAHTVRETPTLRPALLAQGWCASSMVIGRPAHVGCCALVAHAAGALRGQGQPPRQRLPAGVLATPACAPPACPALPGAPRRVHGRLQPCSSKALGRLQQGRAMRCSALRACVCCTGSSRRPAWDQHVPSCIVSMSPPCPALDCR